MDIVRFMGGLGNQMFQYAFMEALRHRGREVFADLSSYGGDRKDRPFMLDKIFKNITIEKTESCAFQGIEQNFRDMGKCTLNYKFEEKQSSIFDQEVFEIFNCTFIGYWQTEKYFKELREEIQEKYCFAVSNFNLLEYGASLQNNVFSIHIRRGDYFANDIRVALYGGICTMDYYHDAMTYVRYHAHVPQFIVFSDDIEWAKTQFKDDGDVQIFNKEIFDEYEDWYDMYLMTMCKGNIIANSSFSWWGAWLNQNSEKIVIAPKVWLNGYRTTDIWCDDWIRI